MYISMFVRELNHFMRELCFARRTIVVHKKSFWERKTIFSAFYKRLFNFPRTAYFTLARGPLWLAAHFASSV